MSNIVIKPFPKSSNAYKIYIAGKERPALYILNLVYRLDNYIYSRREYGSGYIPADVVERNYLINSLRFVKTCELYGINYGSNLEERNAIIDLFQTAKSALGYKEHENEDFTFYLEHLPYAADPYTFWENSAFLVVESITEHPKTNLLPEDLRYWSWLIKPHRRQIVPKLDNKEEIAKAAEQFKKEYSEYLRKSHSTEILIALKLNRVEDFYDVNLLAKAKYWKK